MFLLSSCWVEESDVATEQMVEAVLIPTIIHSPDHPVRLNMAEKLKNNPRQIRF
jgi:hypothetical protein